MLQRWGDFARTTVGKLRVGCIGVARVRKIRRRKRIIGNKSRTRHPGDSRKRSEKTSNLLQITHGTSSTERRRRAPNPWTNGHPKQSNQLLAGSGKVPDARLCDDPAPEPALIVS